jgi:phosphoribosylamine--glycine ligase|tara:strand:+ start:127 stop:1383 length:1257 start_codon:yes stop_codon:yes gene_type:complete
LKILLIGSGGREHAIAWKINQSPKLEKLFIAPGNAGTKSIGTNVEIADTDIEALKNFALAREIDLTIVGPEAPLALGIVDVFAEAGLPIFGPTASAAKLESSKSFAKNVMEKWDIPTALHKVFQDSEDANSYLEGLNSFPTVLKADGLAAGKGVYICQHKSEAVTALQDIMVSKVFGDAGTTLVIEEFLEGWELSVFAFTDGESISDLVAACDYKRIGEGDTGPNTGGMGAFSPPRIWDQNLKDQIRDLVIRPIVEAMRTDHEPFVGTIFAGMMITAEGPKVVEFNCRLGDPETQVILPLLRNDILEIFESCVNGRLKSVKVEWRKDASVAVVLASGGYPSAYTTGYPIDGLPLGVDSVNIFHAGTKLDEEGRIVTNGGRVLAVNALAQDINQAADVVYENIRAITFSDMYYRTDVSK